MSADNTIVSGGAMCLGRLPEENACDAALGNDWADSTAPLHYQKSSINEGEEPALAETLDPNKDGFLSNSEYEQAKAKLREYGVIRCSFSQFKLFAKLSIEDPKKAISAGLNNILIPSEANNSSDPANQSRYNVAGLLTETASNSEGYEESLAALTQAGEIYQSLGMTRELERTINLMKEKADAAGMKDDSAYYSAVMAMNSGDIAALKTQLQKLPKDYPDRTQLDEFVARYNKFERVSATISSAQAILSSYLPSDGRAESEQMPDELSDLTVKEYQESCNSLMTNWAALISNGVDINSETALRQIWSDNPGARRAIAVLYGYRENKRFEAFDNVLQNSRADVVTIADVTGLETNPSPESLIERLSLISANSSTIGKQQLYSIAQIYSSLPEFENKIQDFMQSESGTFAKFRDSLRGFTEPLSLAITLASFGMARIATAGIMAKLAPGGLNALSAGTRFAAVAAETGMESAFITGIQNAMTDVITDTPVDWSAGTLLKNWASMTLGLGLVRASNTLLSSFRQELARFSVFGKDGVTEIVAGRELPALTTLGKTLFKPVENATHAEAFYAGNLAVHNLSGTNGESPEFFDEWFNLLMFNAATKGANFATKGWVDRKAFELRSKPIIEASMKIAENTLGGKSWLSEELGKKIYLAYVKGDIKIDLVKFAKDMESSGAELGTGKSAKLNTAANDNVCVDDQKAVDYKEKIKSEDPPLSEAEIKEIERKKAEENTPQARENIREQINYGRGLINDIKDPANERWLKPFEDVLTELSDQTKSDIISKSDEANITAKINEIITLIEMFNDSFSQNQATVFYNLIAQESNKPGNEIASKLKPLFEKIVLTDSLEAVRAKIRTSSEPATKLWEEAFTEMVSDINDQLSNYDALDPAVNKLHSGIDNLSKMIDKFYHDIVEKNSSHKSFEKSLAAEAKNPDNVTAAKVLDKVKIIKLNNEKRVIAHLQAEASGFGFTPDETAHWLGMKPLEREILRNNAEFKSSPDLRQKMVKLHAMGFSAETLSSKTTFSIGRTNTIAAIYDCVIALEKVGNIETIRQFAQKMRISPNGGLVTELIGITAYYLISKQQTRSNIEGTFGTHAKDFRSATKKPLSGEIDVYYELTRMIVEIKSFGASTTDMHKSGDQTKKMLESLGGYFYENGRETHKLKFENLLILYISTGTRADYTAMERLKILYKGTGINILNCNSDTILSDVINYLNSTPDAAPTPTIERMRDALLAPAHRKTA